MSKYCKPENHIAEISLIGTGGGYGESIVLHIGNNHWIVIDSCIDPFTKKSLPLEYLENLGVDVANDVKLIVCSHWHDDHILGLSNLLKECTNATFCFARTSDRKKFLSLVSLDYRKFKGKISISSTIEFNECIEIINNRNSVIKEASSDKLLISENINDLYKSEVFSLSPSDYTIQEFNEEISTLITEYGSRNKKIIVQSPNSKSVVLLIKFGNHRAILGSDMEISSDERKGWHNIIEKSFVVDKKASYFKVPHHGSKNSYHTRIWSELLLSNPIATLTPWNKGIKLPQPNMLKLYCSHSDAVYMTKINESYKPKKRDRSIEKFIKKMNYKLWEVKFQKGIITSKINIIEDEASWEIKLHENAVHINEAI